MAPRIISGVGFTKYRKKLTAKAATAGFLPTLEMVSKN
ncbi:hypothetical protein Wcon_01502 [Wolbachia endosymbiont of Cylisticus convexus]|nr:hypothetical protein Wcon_01502 [Wolbachia endosymbiont of Cylisticus convexus]